LPIGPSKGQKIHIQNDADLLKALTDYINDLLAEINNISPPSDFRSTYSPQSLSDLQKVVAALSSFLNGLKSYLFRSINGKNELADATDPLYIIMTLRDNAIF